MNKSINKLNKETNGINETNGILTKTIVSLLLVISIVVSGLASYHLFRQFDYNLSALLTITSYLSMVLCIYALSMIKHKPSMK